ncbi:MAG TPA: PAS domain-containing protein [Candidatus Cybelea sp.]|nr:PAS domain-containing protein [Candidatus Cybelea sp.]
MTLSHLILGLSLAYLGLLFAVAHVGERHALRWSKGRLGALVYALSLAIYCTSWTFYGSVGRAVSNGFDFALIYVGPALVMLLALPVLRRIVAVAKRQNVTSVADFLGARYGRSRGVAVLATLIAVTGALPYLALQLQAVSFSFAALSGKAGGVGPIGGELPGWLDTAFVIALMMAVFTILFGVRHVQASEQHRGMMLAIGFESLVKLCAFLAAGVFIVWHMFGGPDDLVAQSQAITGTAKLSRFDPSANWLSITVLSGFAFLCLDRQFHVAVVEHDHPGSLKTARWLFPLYLLLINAFVVPIAMAGQVKFGGGAIADVFVLSLPLSAGADWLTAFVFIGGLSAATSMVAVACMALSGMIGNELVMPWLLARRHGDQDLGRLALFVRRLAVVAILLAAYAFYRNIAGLLPLATIGLISFCAVANLAPALLLGLTWHKAHRHGVILGMIGGFAVWLWTILIPTMRPNEAAALPPLGPLAWFDPLQRGFVAALAVNVLLLVVGSLLARHTARDRQQATAFIDEAADRTRPHAATTKDELQELRELAARFIGLERAAEAFRGLHLSGAAAAEFTERLLSGTIGAASARVVVTMSRRKSAWLPGWLPGSVREMLNEATAAIRYNADVLRKTLDHMGLGIAVFDAAGRIEVWNERFATLTGLAPGSLAVGAELSQLTREVPALIALSRPEGEETPVPVSELRLANGDVTELRIDPLSGGGIVVTANDVTERVRSAEALRDSERRTRIVMDNVPVLIAYVDREQRYRFANHAYQAALGLKEQETDGRWVGDVLDPDRYNRLKPFIEQALKGIPQSFEIDFPTNDANIQVAQGSYIPHVDERGEVLGFFLLYVDTTERRLAEAALRHANESLERRVAERTAELEAARLRAEEANIGKTKFIAAASHDLLQPLHAVRLFVAALTERYRDEELVSKVDLGLGAVEALLDALLDIAKLDAGAIRPEKRPTPLGPLLQSLADAFAPLARRNGIELKLVKSHAWVNTDPALLRRVLQNYLSNAIRYGRATGPRPRVLLGCRRREGSLAIEVRDNGPGIPETQQAAIFQEFTRLRATPAGGDRGLGLGLAIVDRIARMLGHPRYLISDAGEGAAFGITVPLALSEARPKLVEPTEETRGGLLSRAPFVACIDDHAQVLEAMTALLESWGCTVAAASSADRLLAALTAGDPDRLRRPDLLLIDLHLGDDRPDGMAELATLRNLWGPGVPAALITADRDPSVLARARALGLDVLLKPVKPAKLRALLAHCNVRSVA